MVEPAISPEEIDDIINSGTTFFCPDPEGIKKGDRFHLWVKIGGESRLANVQLSCDPYKKGKTSTYVDVFGYEVRKSVNIKKLLKMVNRH